ncbi:MAG TPA: cytochrome b/b6 domain-containing protein [Terriglobales bacterium]|nr:cytochrome b/b6 domain-containing protein [Terriglobales bacterium]
MAGVAKKALCIWFSFFLVSFLYVSLSSAQPATKGTCLACHSAPGMQKSRDGKTVSLQVEKDVFDRSIHGAFECTACHSDISQLPHKADLKPVSCDTCHAASVKAYTESIHAKARVQGFKEPPTCTSCHGDIHKLVGRAAPSSSVNRKNIATTCAACHANTELAKKFRIPLVRPVEAYLQSVHARAVAADKPGAVCTDCHGAHAILPGSDPASQIWRTRVPETCGRCHANILTAYSQSIHGEAVARGVRDAPVCTDCHGEHRILKRNDPNSPVSASNVAGETCGRCHGSTRLSEKYGLPVDKVPAFEDSFHGLALRTGQVTAANCASCHGVHDIRPSSDPRSHVNKANLPATCGQCHPGAGIRFALGPVHVVASAGASPGVYWIRLLYLWIIFVTIGTMFLHNLIDFLRKARFPRPNFEVPANPPERMSKDLRWQHGLVMVSFFTLVYTGFALKYPEGWWVTPLLAWEGRLGLRGLLHRIAAVVLIGSLLWHLIQLAIDPASRAKLRRIKFQTKDVRDFFHLQLYNLGLNRVKPHSGKFNYIEKTEYWAFMWGMLLMTVTGLLLWFENFTLSFLPKWVIDIATTIHFYEAVLASLAILVWHFYWVIFDPEIYPMDASWWHGRSPAARVHERGVEADESKREPESK